MTMQERGNLRDAEFSKALRRLLVIQFAGLILMGIMWALRACHIL